MTQRLVLRHGDCVEVLKGYEDGSTGAIVSDPPYGLSFMGKKWDDLTAVSRANRGTMTDWKRPEWESSKAPKFQTPAPAFDLSPDSNRRMEIWHLQWLNEAFRVLRPGGVIKAFSGTRTFHRMAAAMAEAGFTDLRIESWNYGSGFPKSMNIGKAIDRLPKENDKLSEFIADVRRASKASGHTYKSLNEALGGRALAEHLLKPSKANAAWPTKAVYTKLVGAINLGDVWDWLCEDVRGHERPVVGRSNNGIAGGTGEHAGAGDSWGFQSEYDITEAVSEAAHQWEGWGTALKPSWEPVVVGRKPE